MLQSIECVENEECGIRKHWKAVLLILLFGLIYVLFFMFEPDYEGLYSNLAEQVFNSYVWVCVYVTYV